jgi:phosphoserine phosphatase
MSVCSSSSHWFQNADAICFDVDSTVITTEAIDEFAKYLNVGELVSEMTSKAMQGGLLFEDALAARLNLMRPTQSNLKDFLREHELCFTSCVEEFVKLLLSKGKSVYLISGGFEEMILPLAARLGLPPQNVHANRFLFGDHGEFVDFDRERPTSRSGGKRHVVAKIKRENHFHSLIMIGDGVTDLESRATDGLGADFFVGFGGNQERQIVKENADLFVFSFQELIDLFD